MACAGAPSAAPPPSGGSRRKQGPGKKATSHLSYPCGTAEDFSNPLHIPCCPSWSWSPTRAALHHLQPDCPSHMSLESTQATEGAPKPSCGTGDMVRGEEGEGTDNMFISFPAQPISASRPCTSLGQVYRTGIQTLGEAPGWEQSPVAEGAGSQGREGGGQGWLLNSPGSEVLGFMLGLKG